MVDHLGNAGLYDEDLGIGILLAILLGVFGDVFTVGRHPGAEHHQRGAILGVLLMGLAEVRDPVSYSLEVPSCACHRKRVAGSATLAGLILVLLEDSWPIVTTLDISEYFVCTEFISVGET